eukprot:g8436.t1
MASDERDQSVSSDATSDAFRVAKEFTRLYYHIMNENPEYLHQFYGPTSTVTVSETQDDGSNLTMKADSLELIKGLTLTMFAGVRVALTNCTPQASLGESIQLMVSGVMHQKNSEEERLFTQALLLAKQDHGFFILNDTVHVHSRHSSWKVLSVKTEDTVQSEASKDVPTPPQEPELTAPEIEEVVEQETVHEVTEDPNTNVPVLETPVSEPMFVAEEKTVPVLMSQGRNEEDERVGPPPLSQPTRQVMAPVVDKPLPPPPSAQSERPRSYLDVLRTGGR